MLATCPVAGPSPAYSVWPGLKQGCAFTPSQRAAVVTGAGRLRATATGRTHEAAAGAELGLAPSDVEQGAGASELALEEEFEQVVAWMRRTYAVQRRRDVGTKAERALAALQAADPSAKGLSLERDVLPKVELLDSLSAGLGWRVFCRYPEEFAHPDAADYWRIAAGCLFAAGVRPERLGPLLARHPCVLAATVRDPSNLRRLLDWLRCEASLDDQLRPRAQYMASLGLEWPAVAAVIRVQPQLLLVDSASLQERVDHFASLGLDGGEVARLFARDPSLLTFAPARIDATLGLLRARLPLTRDLECKLLAQSGAVKLSLAALAARLDDWELGLGFAPPVLASMLGACPRVLLYPISASKYRAKLALLDRHLGAPLHEGLSAFPHFVTYSLERLAIRAAAVRHLRPGRRFVPSYAAAALDRFLRLYGLEREEFAAFVGEWRQSEEGRHWLGGGAEAEAPPLSAFRPADAPWQQQEQQAQREQHELVSPRRCSHVRRQRRRHSTPGAEWDARSWAEGGWALTGLPAGGDMGPPPLTPANRAHLEAQPPLPDGPAAPLLVCCCAAARGRSVRRESSGWLMPQGLVLCYRARAGSAVEQVLLTPTDFEAAAGKPRNGKWRESLRLVDGGAKLGEHLASLAQQRTPRP
eukprot:scaffold18.g2043.t1